MAQKFGNSFTVMGCDRPPNTDRFRKITTVGAKWTGLNKLPYDFCKYAKSYAEITCEKHPNRDDMWVCKRCSEMNRPCTWTPRSQSLELWGDNPRSPRSASGKISQYPTGPHRKLVFHNPMAPAQLSAVQVREPFLFDSKIMLGLTDEGEEVAMGANVQLAGDNDGDL